MPSLKPGSRFTSSVCTTQVIVVKRSVDPDETVEVLCTKPGAGSLGSGDALLDLKEAKPLPASD